MRLTLSLRGVAWHILAALSFWPALLSKLNNAVLFLVVLERLLRFLQFYFLLGNLLTENPLRPRLM